MSIFETSATGDLERTVDRLLLIAVRAVGIKIKERTVKRRTQKEYMACYSDWFEMRKLDFLNDKLSKPILQFDKNVYS